LLLSNPGSLALAAVASGGLILTPLLGGPVLLLADGRRYFRALSTAKAEIAAQQVVIAEQKAALEEQIRVKAVVEERQRFVRDMHDGVGGHLFSLLMRVRTKKVGLGEVEGEIQRGLDDLRLVADSLDNVGNDLDTALATFRNRAKQQLDTVGIALKWNQPEGLAGPSWDARQILSLYRLLQEAVSNAARHSGAQAVAIDLRSSSGTDLKIVIADDGRGFTVDQIEGGKGLGNMRKRAEALGGLMEITSEATEGTRIEISFPKAS
jgi:signal transduction histidine kinase